MRRGLAAICALFLLVGTVLVFRAFDRGSHSASDTLRPFLLTMTPVWIAFLAASRVLVTHRRSPE